MRSLIPNMQNKDISRWTAKKKVHTSIPFGKCVPLCFIDILPGDDIKSKVKGLIRMLTPKTQIMDSIYFDIYPYFVPRSQIDLSTKQFYGENESDAWTLHLDHKFPQVSFRVSKAGYAGSGPYVLKKLYYAGLGDIALKGYDDTASGTLLDHFGTPFVYINSNVYSLLPDLFTGAGAETVKLREEPFRVYQKVWNDEFRNPAVVDPKLNWSYSGSNTTFTSLTVFRDGFSLLPAMKSKDLFTSVVVSPERGGPVEISLLDTAPVVLASTGETGKFMSDFISDALNSTYRVQTGADNDVIITGTPAPASGQGLNAAIDTSKMLVDMQNASAITVDRMRFAVATQHFYEWMIRSFRFKDFVQIFFGTTPKSLENDRPLRIGGIHGQITTNQVIQSGGTSEGSSPLGSVGGYSATALQGYLGTLRADVPGTLMFIIVFRKSHAYCQGLDKYWTKETLLDTYLSPFKNIGYVALHTNEVYWRPSNSDVLGYTEYGYEYRYLKDEAHGLMNPLHPQSLSYSTLTDVFDSAPTLDDAFVSEDSSGLDNALIASAAVTDQFYATFHFEFDMTRRMNLYSVPGLDTF